MRIDVNGVRIFFDVEGPQLVPDGPSMRERPTLILLHGGPGLDHSGFRPAFSRFADVAQVVYIDHRGNGRSDRQPQDAWTLAQWGDDVYEFCRALEIEQPVVMGQSFGGFVAIAYATRHPEHPGKLIFSSTAAQGHAHVERGIELFRQYGGPEVGEMARHALTIGYDSPEFALAWMTRAMPYYNPVAKPDPDARARTVMSAKVLMHFLGPGGEGLSFDMLADLQRIQCPTLVLGGEADPITPIEAQEDIARAIPSPWVRFERFPDCGHGAFRDDPRVLDVIRDFIVSREG
jgi:proline iminopeptidase